MAKQKSPIVKLEGSIDDISFYRTQDGHLAREKRGIDPEKLKTDPAFANTRKSMAEFTNAGQAAYLFRKAWNTEMGIASDNRVTGRSVKAMMKVLKSDAVNRRGERKVAIGDPTQLIGFEFNVAVSLLGCLRADIITAINRVTGQCTVTIPALVPKAAIAAPDIATHYRLFAAAAAIDFATGDLVTARAVSADLPHLDALAAEVVLQPALPANSTAPIFLAVGIEYLSIVNGFADKVSKNANAFRLIAVDKP